MQNTFNSFEQKIGKSWMPEIWLHYRFESHTISWVAGVANSEASVREIERCLDTKKNKIKYKKDGKNKSIKR